jgi:hypothetical protein
MLDKLFDTLADMGIWIRFHDKRTEPPTEEGRAWGPAVDGFALSLAPLHEESVSVLIKNNTDREERMLIPGWLRYLRTNITGPGNSPVALKPYGRQVLDSAQASKSVELVFPAGKHLFTEIPIGALFNLQGGGPYRVKVECAVPGHPSATLISNEVTLGSK